MKLKRNMAAMAAALASVLCTVTPAGAELLVMPYSCSMIGGRPQLTPSDQQGHRILTRREDKSFTACSHANPGLCRTFNLHRFTMDCGGAEVPFVALAAASLPGSGTQARLENGRLLMRMPQSWNMAPDDPCARGPGGDPYGRLSRYCADRNAFSQPPLVELPTGFAPMFGLDGIFVAENGPVASASPGFAAAGQPVPAQKPAAVVALPKRRPDVPDETKVAARNVEPQAAAAAPAPVAVTVAPEAPVAAAARPVVALAEVIDRPDVATKPAMPSLPLAKANEPARVAAGPVVSDGVAVRNSISQTTRAEDMAATRPVKITAGTSRWWNSLWVWMAAGLVTLAGGGFLWLRRENSAPPAAEAPRDFASVSLPAGASSHAGDENGFIVVPDAPAVPGALQLYRDGPGSLAPRPLHDPKTPSVLASTEVPLTRDQALEVLGMGVSLDAGEAAMKKIVDGLRMSWHPDRASDEADRLLRELRIRQINAAWDILAAKRDGGPLGSLPA